MKYYLSFLFLIVLAGCSSAPYYELPFEFRNNDTKNNFIVNYSPYLLNKTFFIDPGHGGSDRNNVGFEGKAVEADANLAVALALKDFLQQAGAKVILSRSKDTSVNLKDRSLIANKSGADFFISIHHNAPAEKDDIWTNYSHVYYHATDNTYEYDPSNHDLAKYIQRDLSYAMRNSGGPASFDGTSSDYTIYPGQGFSVLRLSTIPAVLVECGFTTSHFESRRITIPEFNKIEAWGIFKGIARYLANSSPVITFDSLQYVTADSILKINISDRFKIDPGSVKVFIDSIYNPTRLVLFEKNKIEVDLSNLKPGIHDLKVIAANIKENFSLPFHKKFVISVNKKK